MAAQALPAWAYKLLILVATAIWGMSFIVMKDTVDVLPPAFLIGFRFAAAGVVLMLAFWKRFQASLTRGCIWRGAVVGLLIFLAFWIQTIGLTGTTPGKNAFLTATYCVIVPFAWWVVARRRPSACNVVAAFLCVAGIGLVSLKGSLADLTMGYGDFMTLVSAFFFAFHIIAVSRFTEDCDAIVLTVHQFLWGGLCGMVLGFATETLPPPAALMAPDFLWNMVFLVVFSSCVTYAIQNVALAHVPPAQASILLSTESVFGVAFSVLLYGEALSLRLTLGFVLIFIAIAVSEALPMWLASRRESARAGSVDEEIAASDAQA